MSEPNTSELRRKLVEQLRGQGWIEGDAVARAFSKVPREAFVPLAWPGALYRDVAVPTKFNRLGRSVSSSSQPAIMAVMLEMLSLRPGDKVLEVGTGTGYNAALLRELAGPDGQVVSIDYQTDVAREAKLHLRDAGYTDVEVLTGDGARGAPTFSPFDRIIVTAGCRDAPLAWWEQLKPGGLLVLPLSRGCLHAVFSLERRADGFQGRRAAAGFFMSMQGGLGPPTSSQFVGPRRDLGVLGRRLRPDQSEALFRLLTTEAKEEQPDLLKQAFPGTARWLPGEFSDFHAFLATRDPGLIELRPRSQIYPFTFGLALLDRKFESAVVLPASDLIAPKRPGGDWQPGLLAFGNDPAKRRLLNHAEDYVGLGTPRITRLRPSLTFRRRLKGSPWAYSYSYAVEAAVLHSMPPSLPPTQARALDDAPDGP